MGEKRRGLLPVWLWVIIALPLSCGTLAVLVTLGSYALFRQADSTDAEARRVLTAWSEGLLRCAERDRELPPSSRPVPATLRLITGKKYQSAPGEWHDLAHTCAAFAVSEPQEFQYSWLRRSPDDGVLKAVAADGSGRAGTKLEVEITCQAGQCTSTAAALADTAAARERGFKRASHDFIVNLFESAGSKHRSLTYSLASLATIVGFIWLIAAGFSVSVGWGFAVALLPCVGGLAFALSRWDEAKRPFFCWSLGCAISVMAAALNPAPVESKPAQASATESRADSAAPETRPTPPPVPTAAPIPALDGAAVDLSTLMGRARKLADAWQSEAALLGIEATLVDGKVQPQAGGTAKISFGPSLFVATPARSGLFVVTYDKLGIASGPAKGTAGKAMAEPMCAPEGLLPRLDDLKGTPYGLRYAFAPDQRPGWLVTSPTDPKLIRVFDPQDCAVRGSIQLRGKH